MMLCDQWRKEIAKNKSFLIKRKNDFENKGYFYINDERSGGLIAFEDSTLSQSMVIWERSYKESQKAMKNFRNNPNHDNAVQVLLHHPALWNTRAHKSETDKRRWPYVRLRATGREFTLINYYKSSDNVMNYCAYAGPLAFAHHSQVLKARAFELKSAFFPTSEEAIIDLATRTLDTFNTDGSIKSLKTYLRIYKITSL